MDRWSRLTFSGAPGQPARLAFRFTGTVQCRQAPGGALVTHSYELTFRGALRILEALHRRWLRQDRDEDVRRISDVLA